MARPCIDLRLSIRDKINLDLLSSRTNSKLTDIIELCIDNAVAKMSKKGA